jgi:hypothetical protein
MVNLWVAGVGVNFLVVLVVNVKVFLFSKSHYWFTVIILVLSVAVFPFLSWLLTDALPVSQLLINYNSRGATSQWLENGPAILSCAISIYICFMLHPIINALSSL